MVTPQRTLRYPYNKVQGPPIIVGWTMVVSTTPAWGIEPTTSSLGAMSPYHQAKAHGASIKKHIYNKQKLRYVLNITTFLRVSYQRQLHVVGYC
jgi:hypothetical protein